MASAEAGRVNQRLVHWARQAGEGGGPEAFRACSRTMFDSLGATFPLVFEDVSAGAVRAAYADEPGRARAPNVLLFLHGGSFLCGSPQTHARFAIQLGRRLGARALLADYRLSPEHIFPTQIEDCVAVYRWLISSGVDPARVVVAGESAGGNLCFTALLMAIRQGLPVPAAVYAMSPWLDFDATGASYGTNAAADLVSGAETTRTLSRLYLGARVDSRDPVATPLYADLRGMPPIFVQVGGDEVLVDDARSVVARAQKAGVTAELDVVPQMQHMYQLDAGVMPEADASVDRAAVFVRKFLGNQ